MKQEGLAILVVAALIVGAFWFGATNAGAPALGNFCESQSEHFNSLGEVEEVENGISITCGGRVVNRSTWSPIQATYVLTVDSQQNAEGDME